MKVAALFGAMAVWWGWLVASPGPVPASTTSPSPGPVPVRGALSPRVASYRMTARLDPKKHVVKGELTLTWRNPSAKPAASLPFHLYLNAFKHPGTLWLSEAWKGGQSSRIPNKGWGFIDVANVRVDDAVAKTALEADGSVMRVTPAQNIAGGATARISLRFTAQLPKIRARTGYAGTFHMVAQWFPKIGVRDVDGAWHCHPFHMLTEFYADYGRYDVTLEVPSAYDVAATGVRVSTARGKGGVTRYRYQVEDVHDFAWMAAKGARRLRRTLGKVKLQVVYFEDDPAAVRRHMDHMVKSLERLQRWYAPYPYPVLTNILVPSGDALEAGGMEYPTLFTSSSDHDPFLERFGALNTTVHELVHQYFYGLLASNEYQEPWLDEGLTTYVTGQIMDDVYGRDRSAGELGPLRIGYFPLTRLWYRMHPDLDPIQQRGPAFSSALSYFTNVYGKSCLVLRTLEDQIGTKSMRRLIRDYVRRYRFRHPRGADFFGVVDRHVKSAHLRRFVREAIQTPGVLDYRVSKIRVLKLKKWKGKFTNAVDRKLRAKHDALRKGHKYLNRVLVHRRGELRIPVTVEFRFESGKPLRRRWDGQGRWRWFEIPHQAKLVSAVVDPDRTLLLERTILDNGLRYEADARPARRMAGRLLSVMQVGLQVVGF